MTGSKHILAAFVLGLAATQVSAQVHSQGTRTLQQAKSKHNAFAHKYSAKLDSLIAHYASWKYEAADTLSNPYYALLFSPVTLSSSTLGRTIGSTNEAADGQSPVLSSSQHIHDVLALTDSVLVQTYAHTPWFIHNEEEKQGTLPIDVRNKPIPKPEVSLTEAYAKDHPTPQGDIFSTADDVPLIIRRPNFWTIKTNFSLQFTQNYISDNWYKGGESHNALLATTTVEANFNNQSKVAFDNKLEMRLGFQTSHDDKEHKYKTNSDLIRLTNKLGLRALKNWYYTLMLQSWTQFYRGYKANDKKIYSDFMSPFESLLSIGMDYQLSKKTFNISATISPLALKLKYVGRPSLETSFGLTEGHHTKWERGSNITVNYKWTIAKPITWQGRIYYFTDYSKVQVEWENTFNLTINKYLSTRLFLYPRFDDSRTRKEGESYIQFNELLSLGLNVNF